MQLNIIDAREPLQNVEAFSNKSMTVNEESYIMK